MSDFKLFDHLDPALVRREARDSKPSQQPVVWPSKASAERITKEAFNIIGTCMRENYCRMVGIPVSNQIDAKGAWKWVTGRAMEEIVTDLSKASEPLVYVANGIRGYVRDKYLSFELDLALKDPENHQGCITECKTYDGYNAEKEIEKVGSPKLEHLLQVCIYLHEVPTGAALKKLIREGLQERSRLDGLGNPHRNRIEANLEMVESLADGPLTAKLIYISRGECKRTEFDVSLKEDFDGTHYPVVNQRDYRLFTVESIYERFRQVQQYWFNSRSEAVQRLAAKGIHPPETLKLALKPGDIIDRDTLSDLTEGQKTAEKEYLDRLAQEVWALPDEFLPPAEYEWAYTPERIEKLHSLGVISKTKYTNWKKAKGEQKLGDWQCLYCAYKTFCVPKQNPHWSYLVYDLDQIPIEE